MKIDQGCRPYHVKAKSSWWRVWQNSCWSRSLELSFSMNMHASGHLHLGVLISRRRRHTALCLHETFSQWVLVVATLYGVFWGLRHVDPASDRGWKMHTKKWTQIENEWWCPGSRTSYACRLNYFFPFLKYWLMWGPTGGNGKPSLFIDGGALSNAEYWIGMCT